MTITQQFNKKPQSKLTLKYILPQQPLQQFPTINKPNKNVIVHLSQVLLADNSNTNK